MADMADRLQAGIHFRSGESPPDFFVTFNFTPSAAPESAKLALVSIWKLLKELKKVTYDISELCAQKIRSSRLMLMTSHTYCALGPSCSMGS